MIEEECKEPLKALLSLFDSKVLLIEYKKFQFSGKIFEYEFKCEATNGHELIQNIGNFLTGVPKYMWDLKTIPPKKEEN